MINNQTIWRFDSKRESFCVYNQGMDINVRRQVDLIREEAKMNAGRKGQSK